MARILIDRYLRTFIAVGITAVLFFIAFLPSAGATGVVASVGSNSGAQSDRGDPSAGEGVTPSSTQYTPPSLDNTVVVTDAASTYDVTIPFLSLGDLPNDQAVNVQIAVNGSGTGWTNLYQTTIGELSQDHAVTVPRSALDSAVLYDVQVTNWGMSPNYHEEDFFTFGSIRVTTFEAPQFVPDQVFVDSESSEPAGLTVEGLGEIPGAQVFNINIAKPGDEWTRVGEVTAAQIRASGNLVEIPRSFLGDSASYYVELSNWGVDPNFYPTSFRTLATLTVGDFGRLELVSDAVYADENSLAAIEFQLDTSNLERIPGDQVLNIQLEKAGSPHGWVNLYQVTLDELRSTWGTFTIPRDRLDGEGYYYVQVTNWGMSPNYLPRDVSTIGTLVVGQFAPPTFAEDSLHTYKDSTKDVQLQVENLPAFPGDQVYNVQIGQPGTGWQEAGRITLQTLRSNGGIITIPRNFLKELGLHHVQLTNWGMSPDYYPEDFVVGANVVVHEAPSLSFVGGDKEILPSLSVRSDSDTPVFVVVEGYVPEGARITVTAGGDYSQSVEVPAQLGRETFGLTIPGKHLRAVFGRPHVNLIASATLALPTGYEDVTVTPASLPITVTAKEPVLDLGMDRYRVLTGRELRISVSGLDALPGSLPVDVMVTDKSGKTVWKKAVSAERFFGEQEVSIPAGVLNTVGEDAYSVAVSVSSYYGDVVSTRAGITVVTPSVGSDSDPQGKLAATGASGFPLIVLSFVALVGGLIVRRRVVRY